MRAVPPDDRGTSPRQDGPHRRLGTIAVGGRDGLEMRVRPSRIARDEGARSAQALRRLSTALARNREGRRPARGTAFRSTSSPLQQRSLVKISYARNKGRGAWRVQGRYLSRSGAQREGARGLGFDSERSDLDLPDRLDSWQKAGDARLWKIVVSPEVGDRVDLPRHARELMAQVEVDLGTRLEWIAIDHHDTAHPHVHVVVRGVDEDGRPLLLARDYVRGGIRARSQQILTRTLGHRHEHEHRAARERLVEAPRFTEIDRSLLGRSDATGVVSLDGPAPSSTTAQERRLQDLRRIRYLEQLGLAAQIETRTWRLSPQLEPALRQIQLAGDVQKTLARSRTLVSDRDSPVVLARLGPGDEVTGRVTGGSIDEARDEPLLILEGTDGRRHLIPQTTQIVAARGEGRLRPGSVVTLRGTADTNRAPQVQLVEHGTLRDLKRVDTASTLLDRDAIRSVRGTGALPLPAPERRGFFRQWQAAIRSRGPVLEREGLLRRSAGPALEVGEGAERTVEARMNRGERIPTTLRNLENVHGKAAAVVDPGRTYQGAVVGYAIEDDGQSYVVLDTGRSLAAVPTERRDLAIGHVARARTQASSEDEDHRRRSLTWVLDDVEHERDRGRGR